MRYNVLLENDKDHGIYKIENMITGKTYIGQTRSGFRTRFIKHENEFKHNKRHSRCFLDDYKKYGSESFIYSIVQIENDDSKLDNLEREYIKYYKSKCELYNKQDGGNYIYKNKTVSESGIKTRTVTDEQKQLIRNYMRDRAVTDECKIRLREANLGSKSPVAVLDEKIVYEIKTQLVNGFTIKEVSEKYGFKYGTISSVAHERSWSHIHVDGWEEYRCKLNNKPKMHVFSQEEVKEVRKLIDEGYNDCKIARIFGCYSSKINSIRRGKTFKNVI